ncbi:hypothetical protein [Rhodospira trueperi]|uniref:Uncharacterized protein n=1 Tax=Rhodospira trueperi TaxID=69960 RepID=A0A1G6X2H8_9PROT|nr:hypothetical protein [Rhodospira trueperi]SDD72103.1 hypothetical protein SAMN05421720_101346 [Rhodospira trueperi]
MRDLTHNIGPAETIRPAVLTATTTGEPVDLLGFESATAIVQTGAVAGSGDFTPTLHHSDASGSGFEAVTDTDLVGTWPATLAENSVYRVGYTGAKRYLKVVLTKNSGTSVAASSVIVRGHPNVAPVAA